MCVWFACIHVVFVCSSFLEASSIFSPSFHCRMAAFPPKQKQAALTLEIKLEIMWDLEKGNSLNVLVRNSELQSLSLLSFEKIARRYLTQSLPASHLYSPKSAALHCIVCRAKFDLVDEACWKWFFQQRSKGAPVSGMLLQEKAHFFHEALS